MDASRRCLLPTAALLLLLAPSLQAQKPGNPREYPLTQTAQPLAASSAAKGSAPPVAQNLTAERLVNARAEPQNWLTYYGAYDGQRYSALDQINVDNVKNLKPAWIFQYGNIGLLATPATFSFEAAPIVVDGVMYVSGWDGYVWALDAATGQLLWVYQHAIPLDTPICCGNVNRGVAVAKGKVFVATINGYLLALDAATGKLVWSQPFCNVRSGESATAAPLIVKNLVIAGSSGAEYGVRGHLDAFDMDTGRRVWRRYTVPRPGEAGSETWGKTNDGWAVGGGSTWITGAYDPALNTLYWGTGNPGPNFDDRLRPGDNLYTCSVLALNPDDGSIKWHYQWTPHDVWDYDGIGENILLDQGDRKLLAHFDKNGFLFLLDRVSGQFVRAIRFGKVTWGDIDPSTGKVSVLRTPTPEGQEIWPGPAGAKEWPHAAYNPTTGLLYTPVIEAGAIFKVRPMQFRESMPYWGGDAHVIGKDHPGYIRAFDPKTGSQVWEYKHDYPMVASVLTTAGGLVITGKPTGEVIALNARTGELLWQFNAGSGIHSNPVTYSVNGKQYIAVPSGWGGWIEGFAPNLIGGPRGNALFVFALP